MQTVSHYGLHWNEDNVAFLEQGRGGANAVGLKMRSPFRVVLKNKKRHCNHQVALNSPVPDDKHWDYFMQLTKDDLVKNMMPIPKSDGGVYALEQNDQILGVVSAMMAMSAPIYDAVLPMWAIESSQAIMEELHSTNIQPLVITDIEPKHSCDIADVARGAVYAPRKLFLLVNEGVVVPPQAVRLETQMGDPDLINLKSFEALPWQSLGAQVVRKHMRGELHRDRKRALNP
jgi:hypothetical protein